MEKLKLFRLILFCFLTGNGDMHLKNFSVIYHHGKSQFTPCYDLLYTTIVPDKTEDEMALPIRGKRSRLSGRDLIHYFGKDRCGLTNKLIEKVLAGIDLSALSYFDIAGEIPGLAETTPEETWHPVISQGYALCQNREVTNW